jgi:glycosyltransferase involved in cell wall biosynthesis
VTLLYHGLELARFPDPPANRPPRDGSDEADPVRIVTIGRAVEKKGFGDLLQALATLPPDLHWRLVHIGGGELLSPAQDHRQRSLYRREGRVPGPKGQPEVVAMLREADLFVLPSKAAANGDQDGLPNVLMEAASQELAIVATRFAAIPEFIRSEQEGVLVAPGDWEALSNALNLLVPRPRAPPPARDRGQAPARERVRRRPGTGPHGPAAAGRSAAMRAVPVAFYAPLKSPNHPAPSGDRTVARLLLAALAEAGFAPMLASELRSFEPNGDEGRQRAIQALAREEAERLAGLYESGAETRPALWFTYHLYYKAPDHLGPCIAQRLGIPYVVAEASRAGKRAGGPWAFAHAAAERAIDAADLVLVITDNDRAALERARPDRQRLVNLPPFLDLAGRPARDPSPVTPGETPRLLTVAMMREGDKLASYRLLAGALATLADRTWSLDIVGDGPARRRSRRSLRGSGRGSVSSAQSATVRPWPRSTPRRTSSCGRPSTKPTAWRCWRPRRVAVRSSPAATAASRARSGRD